jgi:hypothetical protein
MALSTRSFPQASARRGRRLASRALGSAALVLGFFVSPQTAHAEGPLARQAGDEGALTMAEVGVGALFLPSAPDCLPHRTSCPTSDTALLLTARPLVQIGGRFVFGVSASWGIGRQGQNADIATSTGTIKRTHHRDYFLFSPIVRYYPFLALAGRVDAWVGLTGGFLIVSDRYSNDADGTSSVGPLSLTVSTTGSTFGGGLGFDVRITEAISVGGWTHESLWLLPHGRRCAQTYECATIGGPQLAIEGGLTASYRLRL